MFDVVVLNSTYETVFEGTPRETAEWLERNVITEEDHHKWVVAIAGSLLAIVSIDEYLD